MLLLCGISKLRVFLVPILTQPESWVLLGLLTRPEAWGDFSSNPHPARKLGATYRVVYSGRQTPPCSNPHPARKLGATTNLTLTNQRISLAFQSSPSPKAGCYALTALRLNTCNCGSNPHPARKLGATYGVCGLRNHLFVPILTQPESWVLRRARGSIRRRAIGFQSSPSPKAGCYSDDWLAPSALAVPILTQPESWVLHPHGTTAAQVGAVPILTQPESWVLPLTHFGVAASLLLFQSSPSPKAGCYAAPTSAWDRTMRLCSNPHPARKLGATRIRITIKILIHCSNPHPARKLGATARPVATASASTTFQSSPSPKAGCYSRS